MSVISAILFFSASLVVQTVSDRESPRNAPVTASTPADTSAAAAGLDPRAAALGAETALATSVTHDVTVDGRLDEPDWETAIPITGFTQFEPVEGAAPSHPTSVRILYGESAVYVGAVLHDGNPDQIVRTLSRRDEPTLVDRFWVSIDSYFDRTTAYVFGVSAAGVQIDGMLIDGRRIMRQSSGRRSSAVDDVDLSWDAVWSSAVQVTDEGWVVEMRIPYSMLRFSEAPEHVWGINFRREIARLSEISDWVLIPRSESNRVRNFGELRGLTGIQPVRNLQVTPYTLSRMTSSPVDDASFSYAGDVDVGVDLKMGITSNITLDATINPDFGQVEADPDELNLTTFERILQEKRPFFTEGMQIFNYNLGIGRDGNLLYTRRIGIEASPIIGATKVSGRTDSGLSFGMFGAVTGPSFGPERYYGVTRLRQEFGQQSFVGGMVTGYQRDGEPGLARRTLAGGVDWQLRSSGQTHEIRGHATMTSRAHPQSALEAQTGFGTALVVESLRGSTRWMTALRVYADQFNPNDLGRILQNDWIGLVGHVNHLVNDNQPFGPFRRASVRTFLNSNWSYASRTHMGYAFFGFIEAETHGYNRITISSRDSRIGGYDMRETRGLGPYKNPGVLNLTASVATDSRKTWGIEPGIIFGQHGSHGRTLGMDMNGSWDASSRLTLSGSVEVTASNDVPAWASNEAFALIDGTWHVGRSGTSPASHGSGEFTPLANPGDLPVILESVAPFDGQAGRYFVPIFGDRDTRTVDVTLRSNVTFTPTMSLQLYTQLFAAKGRFERYRVLTSPSDEAAFDAYPKRHDFAFHSFNSNLVFRWEYRPGSALYLVWSQGRFQDYDDRFPIQTGSPFDTGTADRLIDTFSIPATNVFMIKFSYLFLR